MVARRFSKTGITRCRSGSCSSWSSQARATLFSGATSTSSISFINAAAYYCNHFERLGLRQGKNASSRRAKTDSACTQSYTTNEHRSRTLHTFTTCSTTLPSSMLNHPRSHDTIACESLLHDGHIKYFLMSIRHTKGLLFHG